MSPKSLFSPSFAVILLSKVKNWKHPKTGFSQLSVRCSREINRYSCRSHKYTNTHIHKFKYKYKPTNTRSSGRCRRIINRRKPLVTQVPVTESESAGCSVWHNQATRQDVIWNKSGIRGVSFSLCDAFFLWNSHQKCQNPTAKEHPMSKMPRKCHSTVSILVPEMWLRDFDLYGPGT